MKLVSWNVNGLRAVLKKEFAQQFARLDADIFSVQETKCQPGEADFEPEGYHTYFNSAQRKGYSGTACWAKKEPLSVHYGIDHPGHPEEGRAITLEYENFYLVNVYTPNSKDGLARIDYRMQWEDDLREYLMALDAKKPVIYCGDLNVAHEEIDLKNPKTNHQNPGFSDREREKMTVLLSSGFADTFRELYPDTTGAYSWWSYRFKAREKNTGWRIDYFIVSRRIMDKVKDSRILNQEFGSDHCPVLLEIDL